MLHLKALSLFPSFFRPPCIAQKKSVFSGFCCWVILYSNNISGLFFRSWKVWWFLFWIPSRVHFSFLVLLGIFQCAHMFQNAVLSIYFLSVAVCGRWSFLRGIEWTTHQRTGGGWLLGSGSSCNSYAHWNHHPRHSHSECSRYDLRTFLTVSLVQSCWNPRFRVKEIVTPGQEKLHLQIWKTPEMVAAM